MLSNTSYTAAIAAQNRLLRHFLQSTTNFESKTSASPSSLNYVEITQTNKSPHHHNNFHGRENSLQSKPKKDKVLVLMHGYGLGLGFFFGNYDALSYHFDRIIAVDWLGMGCSRSATQLNTQSFIEKISNALGYKNEDKVSLRVADQFIDSLEELRLSENIESMTLAGHALGGYLAAKYALKYPESVDSLVLISPVGIPAHPPRYQRIAAYGVNKRLSLFHFLWKIDVTPQTIVRMMGRRGIGIASTWLKRRFNNRWDDEDLSILADYFYHINAAPGNGEYALNALLEPIFSQSYSMDGERKVTGSVYAKDPLEDSMKNLRMPVLVVYGDNDWLRYSTVDESIMKWRKAGVNADLSIIKNAGHQLFIDNAEGFNESLIQWLEKR